MENEPFNIIIADDDSADRLLFKEALEELKLTPTVHTVENGMELMAYLNDKNTIVPNLIFLDLNMPLKNGLECLKEIRSNENLKDVSIAIYSTSDNASDIDDTFLNGANIYITKPKDFNILKQLLSKAVSTARLHQGERFNRENFFLKI